MYDDPDEERSELYAGRSGRLYDVDVDLSLLSLLRGAYERSLPPCDDDPYDGRPPWYEERSELPDEHERSLLEEYDLLFSCELDALDFLLSEEKDDPLSRDCDDLLLVGLKEFWFIVTFCLFRLATGP